MLILVVIEFKEQGITKFNNESVVLGKIAF